MAITYVARVLSARAVLTTLLISCGLAAAACGSSATTNITGPTATKCQVTLSNSASELPSSGGSATLTVSSERECSWSANANATWIALASTSGQGPATIAYSVQPNPNGTSRRAEVVVSNQSVDILQDAAPCKYSLDRANAAVGASSTDVAFTLTATPGCQWTATSSVDWIAPAAPSAGTGSATVHFTIAANAAAARVGSVKIGDAQATIQQAAASGPVPPPPPPPAPPPPEPPGPPSGCTFAVSPLTVGVPALGGEVHVAVTAEASCAWTATSGLPWVTVTAGNTGTGSGNVVASVAPNTGAARTGTIPVAGQTITINQDAVLGPACTYQLTPESVDLTSDAQDTTVSVAAGDGCQWKPASDVPWITIADPGSGIGNGSFKLTVAANSADARTGTVQVGTATFTVRQAAGSTCTYAIAPTSYDAIRDADAVDVAVTAGPTCAWTATTDATWVTIATGATGTGNGTVHLAIDANAGSARSAVVTIAGQPFAIRQAGICTYAIKPDFYDAGKGPDNISVNVTADAGCTWTASSPVTWATISQGATGTGNGVVTIAVEPNSGPNRAATLTIAGLPFNLTQKGK
ncbi:MAG TPA: BACON domain-containing carbohydrate-binding protein [Vicinamibacterales bacterium]|jgi:hypothetical protein|nr:BACON domain-containing carbohydrate-binding protein [Vicinamibacterales bacterium]